MSELTEQSGDCENCGEYNDDCVCREPNDAEERPIACADGKCAMRFEEAPDFWCAACIGVSPAPNSFASCADGEIEF